MKEYLITIHNDAQGAWRFRFKAKRMPWWRVALIRCAGWTVKEIK